MQDIAFKKMHGLGNDFVILDSRQHDLTLTPGLARAIANRKTGVGCDQLITLAASERADIGMRIHNADGGEVEACGNAARCVALLAMQEKGAPQCSIETPAGILAATGLEQGRVTVDMGPAQLAWQQIPLAQAQDTLHVDLLAGPLHNPVAVNMGNPHAVFFVDDTAVVDLEHWGPILEHHSLFPERANIGVAAVNGTDMLRLRVWERGVGITRACGTGACAAAVAAHRRGLTGRQVDVTLDGGTLQLHWRKADGHVEMTGDTGFSFTGQLPAQFIQNHP